MPVGARNYRVINVCAEYLFIENELAAAADSIS
jgi:hypothetical protein